MEDAQPRNHQLAQNSNFINALSGARIDSFAELKVTEHVHVLWIRSEVETEAIAQHSAGHLLLLREAREQEAKAAKEAKEAKEEKEGNDTEEDQATKIRSLREVL